MAHAFRTTSGIKTFGVFKEPNTAGDYILNKKAKTTFCSANICRPSKTVNTQGNLILLNTSNRLKYYSCKNDFNKANLNINLLTKLDVKDINVIQNINPPYNTPVNINGSNTSPYLSYLIDPTGVLFGNSTRGLNNYVSFMRYNPPPTQSIPI